MLGFLAASAVLALNISSSVGRNRLVYTDTAERGDPKGVALGIAMGAFRGLFVNWLWIRANELKQEGKYYEAIDLAKTITRLQPRFPKVWQFHAWNLAYNISVSTQTPQERWNWVNAGVRLLRNEGIPNCPTDLGIHRELAWIHLHKIQGYMDDAHKYYKREFALEWSYVLGSPPILSVQEWGTGRLKTAYIERWIRPIAESADSEAELYRRFPEAQALVGVLRQDLRLDLNKDLLQRFEEASSVLKTSGAIGMAPNLNSDPLLRLIMDPAVKPEIGRAVMNFTRKKVLMNDYNMEPLRMLRYMEKHGPLDWRHPAAHALYWASRGSEEILMRVNERNRKDYDILNTDRLVIQSIQELFRTGFLTFDVLNPDFYLALPNTEYIEGYGTTMRELTARSDFDDPSRPYRFYYAGYENFMRDGIRFLYRRGDREAAQRYLDQLRSDPLNTNNIYIREELGQPIEQFVTQEILKDDRTTSPTVAMQEIAGSLQNAFVTGLLAGNDEAFRNEYEYARGFHARYQDSQSFKVWLAQNESQGKGRLGLPEFDYFAATILAGLIEAMGIPQGPVLYRRAPSDLQCRAYPLIERSRMRAGLEEMTKQAESQSMSAPTFQTWFPEPQGVEACRRVMFPNDPDPAKTNPDVK